MTPAEEETVPEETAPEGALATLPQDPQALQAIVQAAAMKPLLTLDEFSFYYDAEVALEQQLMAQSDASFAAGDLAAAKQCAMGVRDLNVALIAATERIIEHLEADGTPDAGSGGEQAASLRRMIGGADALAKAMDGKAAQFEGLLQRLQGNPASSIEAFERAAQIYDALSAEDPRLRPQVLVQRAISRYNVKIARALQDMVKLHYQDAMTGYLEARASIEKLLAAGGPIASLPADGPLERDKIAHMVESDLLGVSALYNVTVLFGALKDGDFRTATQASDHLVQQMAQAAEKLSEGGAPELLIRLQLCDRGVYQGWQLYAAAELATDEGQWKEALDLLERARSTWVETATEAIGSGVAQGRAIADQLLSQTTVVLQSAGRRCRRERQLNEKIAELETKLERARRIDIGRMGDLTMEEIGGDRIGGDKVGRDKTGGDKTGGDKITAGRDVIQGSEIDFKQLWAQHGSTIDLDRLGQELGDLRLAVRRAGDATAHPDEIRAVDEAEVAAKTGDGAAALQWLKKAGKWALDLGVKLGTGAAIAAAKSALGL